MSRAGLARPRPTCPRARISCSAREHQRAGRADLDAVAAVDARRVGQRRRRARSEMWASKPRPATAIANVFCASVAARLDALVAEDALRVVAHVEVVVDLRRLRDRRRVGPKRSGSRRTRRCSASASGAVERSTDEPSSSSTSRRLVPDALACRCARPCRPRPAASTRARARASPRPRRRRRGTRSPASASRRSRASASRCRAAAGVEDRRALEHAHRPAVDRELDHALRARATARSREHLRDATTRGLDRVRRGLAEAADRRVAHHLRRARRAARSRRSTRAVRPPAASRQQRLLLPDGADAARHALAARLVAEERGDAQRAASTRSTRVVEDASRRPSRASRRRRARPRT